jgi:hypothetical protein
MQLPSKLLKINSKKETSMSRIDFAVSNSIDGVFFLQQQGTILTYCFDLAGLDAAWRMASAGNWAFITTEGGHSSSLSLMRMMEGPRWEES